MRVSPNNPPPKFVTNYRPKLRILSLGKTTNEPPYMLYLPPKLGAKCLPNWQLLAPSRVQSTPPPTDWQITPHIDTKYPPLIDSKLPPLPPFTFTTKKKYNYPLPDVELPHEKILGKSEHKMLENQTTNTQSTCHCKSTKQLCTTPPLLYTKTNAFAFRTMG